MFVFQIPADCTCKVSIPLTTDTESHGCNGGWVGQFGMPAMVTVQNQCGHFKGFQPALNNGDYLGTHVMDGLFAGNWVSKLKMTATLVWVPFDSANRTPKTYGLVTYGDCTGGSSFAFSVQKNLTGDYLVADLELQTSAGLEDFTLSVAGVSIQRSEDVHPMLSC